MWECPNSAGNAESTVSGQTCLMPGSSFPFLPISSSPFRPLFTVFAYPCRTFWSLRFFFFSGCGDRTSVAQRVPPCGFRFSYCTLRGSCPFSASAPSPGCWINPDHVYFLFIWNILRLTQVLWRKQVSSQYGVTKHLHWRELQKSTCFLRHHLRLIVMHRLRLVFR